MTFRKDLQANNYCTLLGHRESTIIIFMFARASFNRCTVLNFIYRTFYSQLVELAVLCTIAFAKILSSMLNEA